MNYFRMLQKKWYYKAFWALILASAAVLGIHFEPTGLLNIVEWQSADVRQQYFARKSSSSSKILIIDVSDKSLKDMDSIYGRWPWPRDIHSALIDYLVKDGAGTIAFDVLFTERTRWRSVLTGTIDSLIDLTDLSNSSQAISKVKGALLGLQPSREDSLLGQSACQSGRVVLNASFSVDSNELKDNPFAVASFSRQSLIRQCLSKSSVKFPVPFSVSNYGDASIPLPFLCECAAEVGHTFVKIDRDGVYRRWSPFVSFQNTEILYPSFSLAIAAHYLGTTVSELYNKVNIPVFNDGTILINYQADNDGTSPYRYLHYSSFLSTIGKLHEFDSPPWPPGLFKDKIVLIGASARALGDTKSTSIAPHMPGVELHAHIIDNILSEHFIKGIRPWQGLIMSFGISLATGLLAMFAGPWVSLGSMIICLIAVGAFSWFKFDNGELFPLVVPIISIMLTYLFTVIFRYITETREKLQVKKAFGRYLSPAVLEKVLENPASIKLRGEKKIMTVMFTDLAGFTSFSEGLPPEEVSSFLKEYMTHMVQCIINSGGIVDKFIGDAVVAEWNAPGVQPDHAARACNCAINMQNELAVLNQNWALLNRRQVAMRIGINSGEMIVGNLGSEQIFDYTVIGNEVNTGSRLEPLNKDFGTSIIISGSTFALANTTSPGTFLCRHLARVAVKGRTQPIKAYELAGLATGVNSSRVPVFKLFTQAVELFENGDFQKARREFESILNVLPEDGPCKRYIEMCSQYQTTPPGREWDGIYIQVSK